MSASGLKIALVHPTLPGQTAFEKIGRSDLPPLGILYIASSLLEKGHTVKAYDLALEKDEQSLSRKLLAERFDIVGISTMAPFTETVLSLAKTLKGALPESSILVAGGPDATINLPFYEATDLFDAVLIGEAEQTMARLADDFPKIPHIDGVWVKGRKDVPLPKKIVPDDVSFPARRLLPLKKYRGGPAYKRRRFSTSIFSHRGCPYNCAFCEKGVHDGPVRFRSAQSIFEEILTIRNEFDIHDIRFIDDVFTVNGTILDGFLEAVIRSGEKFDWMCCGRVDKVNDAALRKMKRAGCYRIEYGVESGNDRILEMVHKGANVSLAIEAIRDTRKAGIESIANFILGFPTETEDEMRKTVDFSVELDSNYSVFFPFTPFVGADLTNEFNLEWDREAPYNRAQSNHYIVPTERVLKLVDQAYGRFYFRAKTILKFFATIRSGWIYLDLFKMAVANLIGRIWGRL